MSKYIAKEIKTIEAEQFLDIRDRPQGVKFNEAMGIYYVTTANDTHVQVSIGEWIVKEGPKYPNRYYPISAEVFHATYKKLEQ